MVPPMYPAITSQILFPIIKTRVDHHISPLMAVLLKHGLYNVLNYKPRKHVIYIQSVSLKNLNPTLFDSSVQRTSVKHIILYSDKE